MYKLLLCDDDQIVLEGLKNWVGENFPQLRLVGCAASGMVAKELIDLHKPNILVTDICMPFFSGLQLIEYAQTVSPFVCSIIISGYDDFRYARKAVQLGAMDFVLKPINVDELGRLLHLAIEDCARAESNQELSRKNALKRLIDAKAGEDVSDALEMSTLPPGDHYQIVILENEKYITDNLDSLDEYRYGIYKEFNQMADQIKEFGSIISHSYSNMVVCLHGDTEQTLKTLCDRLEELVRRHNRVDAQKHFITMAKSAPRKGLARIQKSYLEAVTVMRYKYVLNTQIVDYASIRDKQLPDIQESTVPIDGFTLSALDSHRSIDQAVARWRECLIERNCTSTLYLSMVISNIYIKVSKELTDEGVKLTDIFQDPFAQLQKMLFLTDFSEKMDSLRDFLYQIHDYITPYNQHKHTRVVNAAIQYLQEHYNDPSLSMETTAQSVFMSTNYFSTIFKEQTGQTFTNYLMDFRVEKAKYLIEHTNYMFYEISAIVGYPNAPYFSSLFKKKTGYSPSEYKAREALGKPGESGSKRGKKHTG